MSLAPPARPQDRVFANASLRLDAVRAVGFDMDYTLAIYDSEALEGLAFSLAVESLAAMGYPPVVSTLRYRPGRTIRGLVVDKDLGNVLKMDRFRYVSIARHGEVELDSEARRAAYANQSVPLSDARFTSVDTLFHMPEVDLFAQLVAARDADPAAFGPRSYGLLWSDLRHAIDIAHRDGSLKRAVMADLDRFFVPDPDLAPALAALRAGGKKLFLLTNSELEYTEAVMSHLLDGRRADAPRWVDYFDEIVVHAGKPGYFLRPRAGEVVREETGRDGVRRDLVRGGNFRELHRRLGCEGDQVLFVGDHIYGDVIRSKTHSYWRTFMVVPELDHEIAVRLGQGAAAEEFAGLIEELGRVDRQRAALRHRAASGDPPAAGEAARADADAAVVTAALKEAEDRLDRAFHPQWGPLFYDGAEVSRFGAQVTRYADLYASRVSNLARYVPDKWFHTPWESLPHTMDSGDL